MEHKLFKKLIDMFGHIYVLTMSNRPDRQALINEEFKNFGIPTPDTDPRVRWFYGTPFPHNKIIADAFNRSGKGRFTKPNEYDCARNHYAIIKTAYDLGWERVLIVEDDILFLNNADVWLDYLYNVPVDFDILQFGGFTTDKRILDYMSAARRKHWFKHKNVGLWTTAFYALSRKGMEFYLAFMDSICFWVADGPLYKAPLSDKVINTYASEIPLVIQADKAIVSSDIRDEKTDKIDYNNENEYERNVRTEDYYFPESLKIN